MTQILAALTHEYVLVASDRRLTLPDGRIYHDDTCKLVSLCGIWGISYTGFGVLDGVPTHKWIALRLAEKGCRSPYAAGQILANAAAIAVKAIPSVSEQTFLIAGWGYFPEGLEPHFLLISNMYDADGRGRTAPGIDFNRFERRLKTTEAYVGRVIGIPLPSGRGKRLDRYLRRLLKHRVGPKLAMQAFVEEIVNTPGELVGDKVLAFSIPREAADRAYKKAGYMLVAAQPDLHNAAFCYFDPSYSRLRQYGPTSVCGEFAVTDLEGEDDPSRQYQSSSVRILHLPKGSG